MPDTRDSTAGWQWHKIPYITWICRFDGFWERALFMRCPYCSDRESKVTDSRTNDAGIRRRRECLNCRQRFTTYERVQAAPLMVYKRDGRREEFNREKMIAGLHKACAKRPVTPQAIEQLVDEVESELHRSGNVEADTFLLGSLVMERLPDLDRVAYIRYASVYRDFQDIESFERAVRDLRDGSQQLPLLDMPPPRSRGRGRRRAGPVALLADNSPREETAETENNRPEVPPESPKEEKLGEAVGTMGVD